MGRRIDVQTFAAADPADVHARHRTFFKALLQHTRALNKTVVTTALPGNLNLGQKDLISAQLVASFSDLLRKDRNNCQSSEAYNEILSSKRLRTEDTAESLVESPVDEEAEVRFQHLIEPAAAAPVEILSSQESPTSDDVFEALRDRKTDEEYSLQQRKEEEERRFQRFLQRTGSSFAEVTTNLVEVAAVAGTRVSPDRGIERASKSQRLEENPHIEAIVGPIWIPRASAAESSARPAYASMPSWFNGKELKMQLEWPPGNAVFGDVEVGPRGYLMVTWPDGSIYETDISNLALSAGHEVMKKPAAAVRKKPAAAHAHSAEEEEAEEPDEPEELEEPSESEATQPPVRKKPAAARAHSAGEPEDPEELEEPEEPAEQEEPAELQELSESEATQQPVRKKPAAASTRVAEAEAETAETASKAAAEAAVEDEAQADAAEEHDFAEAADAEAVVARRRLEEDSQDTWPLPGVRSPESPAAAADAAPFPGLRSPEELLIQERAICFNAMAAVPAEELAALGPGLEPVLHQDSPELGKVKTYMGKDKAYIQYLADGNRWTSVTNIAKTASAGAHKQHCLAIWHQLGKPGFNSTRAEELKQALQRHRISVGSAEGEDVN